MILFLRPSVGALRRMICICDEFAEDYMYIIMSNSTLTQVEGCYKYLGVIFYSKMSWVQHITYV